MRRPPLLCGASPTDRREVPPPDVLRNAEIWLGYSNPHLKRAREEAWAEARQVMRCPGVAHSPSECRMARLGRGTGDREHMVADHLAYYTDGLSAPRLDSDIVLFEEGDLRITVVSPDAPEEQHIRATWIAARAAREMPYDSSPYAPEPDIRRARKLQAFLIHVDDRLVGVVLTTCRNRVYAGEWVGEHRCFRVGQMYVTEEAWLTISFAWVYGEQRRRGLVRRTLEEIALRVGASTPGAFAWEAPFSRLGKQFVDQFRPEPLTVFLQRDQYNACDIMPRVVAQYGVDLGSSQLGYSSGTRMNTARQRSEHNAERHAGRPAQSWFQNL